MYGTCTIDAEAFAYAYNFSFEGFKRTPWTPPGYGPDGGVRDQYHNCKNSSSASKIVLLYAHTTKYSGTSKYGCTLEQGVLTFIEWLSFVLYREVFFIRKLKCTGIIGIGTSRFVHYREVFYIRSVPYQRFHCAHSQLKGKFILNTDNPFYHTVFPSKRGIYTVWWCVLCLLPCVHVLHTCIASTQQQCFWQKVRTCSSRVAVSAQRPALSLHTLTTHSPSPQSSACVYQVIQTCLNK